MALKRTTNKPTQHELRADETSQQPLVNLVIERPEPLLAGCEKLRERAKNFAIIDAETYTLAASTRQEIKAQYDAMEQRRVKMKAPALEAGRQVDNFFNPALDALDEALKALTAGMKKYDDEQRAIAARKQREAEEEARKQREQAEREAAERRKHTQMCMSEIQGIQQQVIIAQQGRLGVRKGGTLECIRETLAETEKWPIEREHFGDLYDNAVQAKQTAITAIKALEGSCLARQEQERIAREQEAARAAGNAEALRKAQEEAKVQRAAAIEARKAELHAQEEARAAEERSKAAAAAREAEARALEQRAANTVAPKIEADLVQVNGLQRPKVWKWRLKDKSKLKPEFLLIDEKSINRLVSIRKDTVHEVVGIGAIEVFQDEGIRQ